MKKTNGTPTLDSIMNRLSTLAQPAPKAKPAKTNSGNVSGSVDVTYEFANGFYAWLFNAFDENAYMTRRDAELPDKKTDGHMYVADYLDNKTAPKGSGLTRWFFRYNHGDAYPHLNGGTIRTNVVPEFIRDAWRDDFGIELADACQQAKKPRPTATPIPVQAETGEPVGVPQRRGKAVGSPVEPNAVDTSKPSRKTRSVIAAK